jgi:hypothetical protein
MSMKNPDVNSPVLSQPEFCSVTGLSMKATNNLVDRRIFLPSEIGGRHVKGTRLYSIAKAFQGKIINETTTHNKITLGDAAAIAELGTKGGFIEHWARAQDANRPYVPAYMVVAWTKDCYEAQVISGGKAGWPDFSSVPNLRRRFFAHPFLLLPLSDLFFEVRRKALGILASHDHEG